MICRSVTTGNVLDEDGTMFRVSVAFPLAKMCQLIYYCVSACSFVQKFCGFQFLVSLFNIKYNIQGHPTRIQFKTTQHSIVERILVFKRQIQAYFYPLKLFICSDFLAESLVIRKLQGSKLTFSKISARKRLPKILAGLFQGKNLLKMGNYTILQMFENPRRGRQARNFTTNVPKILDLKSSSARTDIFRKLPLGAPEYTQQRR